MKLLSFKTIRTRLTTWFLILALAPLFIGILITYYHEKQAIELENFYKLAAIRDLKVQQLESWLEERKGDLHLMIGDLEIRSLETIFDKTIRSSRDLEKIEVARDLLTRNQLYHNSYEEIFIIGANTKLIEVSSNNSSIGDNKSNNLYFTVPLETGEIYIKDIYYSKTLNRPQMTISMPILCLKHSNHIIGIMVVRINLENTLYKLLLNKVGLGETGETLIVNKDLIALNELRSQKDAVLNLKINAEPAVEAASGKTGITKTLDYQGKEVLAAYTYIPQMGWGFISKQDLSELNIPIRALVLTLLILFIISALIIVILVFWLSEKISKPIVDLDIAANKIRGGDYSVRTVVDSKDELASLANSINEMTASIESRIYTQKGVADISDTMIGQSSIQQFGSELLKQLMKITDANMSTFYILNEATKQYEHFSSVGVNEKLLSPFSAENPEGEVGNAISRKRIYYLRDIPENTIFNYKTSAGNAIPREIITIPILVDDNVVAIISLVNIHSFSKECYDILKQSWSGINVSYSNLMASERTQIFAEQLSQSNQQLEVQTEELQDQAEELQEQAEELQRSTIELQEQNIELENQKKQVEGADRLKSEFLSNMSHELRTPLNSIMALSRVLIMQAKDKLNDEENNYLEIVERNGKRLLSLINNILDLSKIESGKMDVEPKHTSIGALLQLIKENIQTLSEEKDIALNLNIPNNLSSVETDEARLHQVLLNVVSNAVKFTKEGAVDITVNQDSQNVYIEVKDSGIGISQEVLPHIFDEFRQADGTSSRQYEGTGLGLAIAYKLTQALGGIISVKSKLGEGSVFTISIPIKWHEDEFSTKDITIKTRDLQTDKKIILVVDDDPETVKNISNHLKEFGFKTIGTTSGREALKLAEKYQPFAITLDVIMPEMDGWEVLQELKNNLFTKDIPVIIVSISDDKDTGFALGAVGYINKPVEKKLLVSEIYKLHALPDTVMIVDDNEFEREHMSKIIEAENINTILAKGGTECIELLKNKIPDILVLDLMMPDMNGFKVLEKIRKNAKTKDLPVIVVTAKDLTKEDKENLSGKISSIITKSDATQQDLFKEIQRILAELEKSRKMNIPKRDGSKNNILIVEDNPDAIIQIKAVLENENYKVDIAGGGQEALDYLQHSIPDGIILDLMMPDIDGFDVLNKIRNTQETKNIPVLILTAKDLTKEDLSKLSSNNIQQLIHKGDVNIEGLLLKVSLMLGIEPRSSKFEVSNINEKEEIFKPQTSNLNPTVLIVEDNPDNMTTIKAILKNKYAIAEAVDGEEGLRMSISLLPDLILLDMSLPRMDGEKVTRLLKENNETKNIPIIAVTAQAMKGDSERFIEAGCNGYIPKPIDPVELLTEISKLLNG